MLGFPHKCPQCKYPLRVMFCPECGRPAQRADLRRRLQRRRALPGKIFLAISPWFAQVMLVLSMFVWGHTAEKSFFIVVAFCIVMLMLASPAFCMPLLFLYVDRKTHEEWRAFAAVVWLGVWALQVLLWIVLPLSTFP
jgi:hypothetical protein